MKWSDDEGVGVASGPKGSVLAERHARGMLAARSCGAGRGVAAPIRFPTNEEVVKALQERVEVCSWACRFHTTPVIDCGRAQPSQGSLRAAAAVRLVTSYIPLLAAPRVQQTVDLCENYRHALLYMLFVGVYFVVLYFQASLLDPHQ